MSFELGETAANRGTWVAIDPVSRVEGAAR